MNISGSQCPTFAHSSTSGSVRKWNNCVIGSAGNRSTIARRRVPMRRICCAICVEYHDGVPGFLASNRSRSSWENDHTITPPERRISRLCASSAIRLFSGTAWYRRPSAKIAMTGISGSLVLSSKSGTLLPICICGVSVQVRVLCPGTVMVALLA
ncbi:Uncharacterised protein [Mycobacteroides abscessus subsp. abscessus]|nr:Uncharacterised protein [Mycobacteroides abscessus subsp. abscessus]